MSKSTTIINHLNTDRITEIIICNHKYLVFTVMYRNLIVIECDKNNPILLFNRSFSDRDKLSNEFDKIIVSAAKAIDTEDFVTSMDTYIELFNNSANETVNEIIAIYKIIIEDYGIL